MALYIDNLTANSIACNNVVITPLVISRNSFLMVKGFGGSTAMNFYLKKF